MFIPTHFTCQKQDVTPVLSLYRQGIHHTIGCFFSDPATRNLPQTCRLHWAHFITCSIKNVPLPGVSTPVLFYQLCW